MRPLSPVLLLLFSPACFDGGGSKLPPGFAECAAPSDGGDVDTPATPTYYQNAKPIIDARCAGCHRDGGIAPFSLETFEDAFFNRVASFVAISDGRMPPWDPNPCCREYRHDRSLGPAERATLLDWIDQGGVPGDPDNPGAPLESADPGLSRVDLTLRMPEPFTPRGVIGDDELRCFVIDWPLDEPSFVTGINVRPGNPEVVHHVIAFLIDGDQVDALRDRGDDGRPGFDCWGELGALPESSLGVWTPGQGGHDLPDGLGRAISGDAAILLQVHYDTSSGSTAPDQTSLELKLDAEVERAAQTLGVGNPQWLLGDGMAIAAGAPDTMYWFAYDPSPLFDRPVELHSVSIHMHDYGSAGSLAVLRRDGTVECLLDVADYDFSWHGDYELAQPVILEAGDQLYVECHFDNTAANQRLVDGELETPRDLRWGTDSEMCVAIITMSEVPR